jgi:membrane protein
LAVELLESSGITVGDFFKRLWAEIRADDVFGRAAQLAYYFFLALFPFLICVIATLSMFGTADRGRELLFVFFARFLPAPAFELITRTFSEIIASSGPLKMSFGIIASLWSASLGMSAVMDTLNTSYHVQETRSLLKQYGVALGLTFGMGLLVVISTVTILAGDAVIGAVAPARGIMIAWRIAQWPFALALLLFGFALTYYFAPDLKDAKWHWITPGSVAGVLLLVVVSLGLRIYLHFAGSYNTTYGSLGGVIVLLLCFYLGGIAVLSGGALNGVIAEIHSDQPAQRQ